MENFLNKYRLPYIHQYSLPALPTRKYDFFFVYSDQEYLVEFDGRQHFEREKFFCNTEEKFIERKQVDLVKSVEAIKARHKLIRLDYKTLETVGEIERHLLDAIAGSELYYLSDAGLYKEIALEMIKYVPVS